MGIKEGCPAGDESQDSGAEGPPDQGVIFQLLVNPCRSIRAGLNQDDSTGDPFRPAEHTQHIRAEEHVIGQVTQLLVNVEGLGEENDLDLVVSLELEPVTDFRLEILEVAVVPDHSDFINEKEGLRGDLFETDIVVVDMDAAI